MDVPICIFVLILGCLNRSCAQRGIILSQQFSRNDKTRETRSVVHIPQPSVNKGMTRTKSESSNPQNEGYILVPQVVKVPKRDSTKRSTSASKRERPSNVKRITSIDLLTDLKLNPSRDRLFNLTRIPSRDRFTDYTGSSNRDVTTDRNRPSGLDLSSNRDIISELNQLSPRDRQSNSRKTPPVTSTVNRMSSSQIETISQILNVPRSKVLAKLPEITRIFSQAAKIPNSDMNSLLKNVPRMIDGPSLTKEPQRKYPLVQQQSPQQKRPQQQSPQQQRPQQGPQQQRPQQGPQQQRPQQEQAPRLQLQQREVPKPVGQQNMPAFTTNPQIYNSPQIPGMTSPPVMKAFTDGSERGVDPRQVADPMNSINSPIDPTSVPQMSPDMPPYPPMDPVSMQQMSPDMPQYPPMDPASMQQMSPNMPQYPPMDPASMQQMSPDMPRYTPMDPASMQQMSPDMPQYPPMSQPSLMPQMANTFSDGTQIPFESQPPGVGPSMPSDLTAIQPMPQMGPGMPPYSAMGQPTPPGNPMSDMSFMPPPDMSMSLGFQDTSMPMPMPMGPFGANADPACALGQVYATCTMARIEEKSVYGNVHFSQQVDPMCTPIGNLMVNVKLFGFNPEDMNHEHGLHVHEYGDVRHHCTSAGRHFNPFQMTHGGRQSVIRHLGDFGNVREDAEGNIFQTFHIPNTSIIGPLTIVGKALVIKSGPDDLGKDGMSLDPLNGGPGGYPAGCCVIGKSEETRSAHIYNQMPGGNMNMGIS